ncbi:hypothetical protein [Paenibacillus sp. DMB5]|uniref:hypothetical protein n=1 Tax=Paenibacillus sp. DMB5 TaxID=1780103 RepID=UPI000A76726D|nr:hypothetical protein [Paenibacillus sp. DMB5]
MAVLTSSFLPELISLLLPVAGAGAALMGGKRTRVNLPAEVLPASQAPAAAALHRRLLLPVLQPAAQR